MKLINDIKNQEKIVTEMNDVIDSLIKEQHPLLVIGKEILRSPVGRFVLRKLGTELARDVDDDDVDTKDIEQEDIINVKDVEEVLKDVEVDEETGEVAQAELDRIEKELDELIDKQIELVNKYNKTGYATITITFNDPIPFKIKRGTAKGKELRLEKTKRYDIYQISKEKDEFNKKGDYKIYFTYEEWLKEYGIMFSLLQENIVKDTKKGDTTINVVYVDTSAGEGDFRIISEQILTKRAVIEIDDVK